MVLPERRQPLARRSVADGLGSDKAGKPFEAASIPVENRVSPSPLPDVGEQASLAVPEFDGLTIGAHDYAEAGNVDSKESHSRRIRPSPDGAEVVKAAAQPASAP